MIVFCWKVLVYQYFPTENNHYILHEVHKKIFNVGILKFCSNWSFEWKKISVTIQSMCILTEIWKFVLWFGNNLLMLFYLLIIIEEIVLGRMTHFPYDSGKF